VLPDVADEVGLSREVPVIAVGSHDTASAVAAIPGLDSRSAFISSGTWSLMGVDVRAPIVTEQTLALGFSNEGGVGGTTRLLRGIPGLWLLQECRRQWRREGRDYTWDQLVELAAAAKPLQCLFDVNAPELVKPADMPAAIRDCCRRSGGSLPTGVAPLVRACLESLALAYRLTLANLETLLGRQLKLLRVVGGGSRNALLCQMAADACGIPVVAGPAEATALGNLMLQAIAVGEIAEVKAGREAVAASVALNVYEPTSSRAWDEAIERHDSAAWGATPAIRA
jgi:rhamnulokinase